VVQAVEADHAPSALEQSPREAEADESRSAGDENWQRHSRFFPAFDRFPEVLSLYTVSDILGILAKLVDGKTRGHSGCECDIAPNASIRRSPPRR
jgi:hypothetical protein